MDILAWLAQILLLACLAIVGKVYIKQGSDGVLLLLIKFVRAVPGVDWLLINVLSGVVTGFVRQVKNDNKDTQKAPRVCLPEKGVPKEELLKEMEQWKAKDINPEDGKIFAYVYTGESDTFELQRKAYDMFCERTGLDPEHDDLIRTFHHAFMHENALNPMVFPSLRQFENEVISMTAGMLNGDDQVVGSLTSGGTESLLMAMKTYRDRAKKLFPHIKNPEMVAPITIHPAHEKAAHYFGFTVVHVPVGDDFRPNVWEYEQAITPNTIALLCSAPQYCHGVIDPVEEISEIACRRGLPMHVDACFGGFMLPWVEKLGHPVAKFDFRLPGVTSMSADIHKYGFGTKGASVVLYRNAEFRKYQIFAYSKWPGGLFGSPSMAGTRPGGNIASAWVALKAMGVEGYMETAKKMMETTKRLTEGINAIPGLCILGKPQMTAFAFGSDDPLVNILHVADIMEEDGWKVERQQCPDSLHVTVLPHHNRVVDSLLEALAACVKKAKEKKGVQKGQAAMYGMVANIPDKSVVDEFIVEFFSEVYKL